MDGVLVIRSIFYCFFFQECPSPTKNLVACIRRRRSTLRYINYFLIFSPAISTSPSEYLKCFKINIITLISPFLSAVTLLEGSDNIYVPTIH